MNIAMNIPKNRWSAFAVHFGFSLLIFIALLGIILLFWYPGALFATAGGWQGIQIVVGVDLVLGPLLTLIVYNLDKPRRLLYRDLAIIGAIQLSCLSAGVYIVYTERPVAVIFSIDKFYALKKSEFIANGKDPKTLHLGWLSPTFFQVNLQASSREEAKLIEQLNALAGKSALFRTDLYGPLPRSVTEAKTTLAFSSQPQASRCPEQCLTAELVTAYAQGSVCFDPAKQCLEKFVAK